MSKYLYRKKSKFEVIAEYAEASGKTFDFEKAKWGSPESMLNRFRLAVDLIDWLHVKSWLDIGCGNGLFFSTVEKAGYRFKELAGVDITPEIIEQARVRTYASSVHFYEADLEAMPTSLSNFGLVTLIGTLQQCGTTPECALAACIERLGPEGQLFLTTKNLGWGKFRDGSLLPESHHSWFDYDELRSMVENLGIEISRVGGFLPREGKKVPIEESHTLFILGRK